MESLTATKRGRGGRPKISSTKCAVKTPQNRNAPLTKDASKITQKPRAPTKGKTTVSHSFNFTKHEMRMAEFIRDNRTLYEKMVPTKKGEFLSILKDKLQLGCTKKQLTNKFTHFLTKYTKVKKKLALSGFGIDPDKDKSLITGSGWILKMCPYYEILDEVLGCKPNVSPPSSTSTAAMYLQDMESIGSPGSKSATSAQVEIEDQGNSNADDISETEEGENFFTESEYNEAANSPGSVNSDMNEPEPDQTCPDSETDSSDDMGRQVTEKSDVTAMQKFVKGAVAKISIEKDETKTPVGLFSKIMSDKMEVVSKIEESKLDLEERKFQSQLKQQKELATIESDKIKLEREKMAERALEREHELKKIKLEQQFELQKLRMQLQLQNKEQETNVDLDHSYL